MELIFIIVILLGTKIDKIASQTSLVDIEKELVKECSQWGLNLGQKKVIFVTNKTGKGIPDFISSISGKRFDKSFLKEDISRNLIKAKPSLDIPEIFLHLERAIEKMRSSNQLPMFCSLSFLMQELEKFLHPTPAGYFSFFMIILISDLKLLMDDEDSKVDFAIYLQDTGLAMYDNQLDAVFLKPTFLSKIMALFIAPEQHMKRLNSAEELGMRSAIVTYKNAVQRLKKMEMLSGYTGVSFWN